jgi:hypothetical protein
VSWCRASATPRLQPTNRRRPLRGGVRPSGHVARSPVRSPGQRGGRSFLPVPAAAWHCACDGASSRQAGEAVASGSAPPLTWAGGFEVVVTGAVRGGFDTPGSLLPPPPAPLAASNSHRWVVAQGVRCMWLRSSRARLGAHRRWVRAARRLAPVASRPSGLALRDAKHPCASRSKRAVPPRAVVAPVPRSPCVLAGGLWRALPARRPRAK